MRKINKINKDYIFIIIINIIIIVILYWYFFIKKERSAAEEKTSAYITETFKDEKDNKTYKIIKDKLGDVIFCEELQEEEK